MTIDERLVDLFHELDRQTTVPPGLEARLESAIGRPRPTATRRIVGLVAAALVIVVGVAALVRAGDDVVENGPLATTSAAAFDADITATCTEAARAMTAVGPRFTTAAAYAAATDGLRDAVAPLIDELLAAVPPQDDVELPARVLAALRSAEAQASQATRQANAVDIAAAASSFAAAEGQVDDALRTLVDHGARCSTIGTED